MATLAQLDAARVPTERQQRTLDIAERVSNRLTAAIVKQPINASRLTQLAARLNAHRNQWDIDLLGMWLGDYGAAIKFECETAERIAA